jgi:hypothetical protein
MPMNSAIIVIAVFCMKAVCASLKKTCAKIKHALGMGIVLISITSLDVFALVHMKEKVAKQ